MTKHGVAPEQRYGRMFSGLKVGDPGTTAVNALIRALTNIVESSDDNDSIPAGYTYFGQFIDHDLTFDKDSAIPGPNNPSKLENLRTPRLDLDSVYGPGPGAHAMYDPDGRLRTGRMLGPRGLPDLLRSASGVAIIGDPRNDENQIIAQMHLLWVGFHNLMIDRFAGEGLTGAALFTRARQEVTWTYQSLVYNDFLNRILGPTLAAEVRAKQQLKLPATGAMPVEFSGAAYRFGHSMIRTDYNLAGDTTSNFLVFSDDPDRDLRGFRPISDDRHINWANFFMRRRLFRGIQKSMNIDHKLSEELMNVPERGSLPGLNLKRGIALRLPAGGAVAKTMNEAPLTIGELFAGVDGFADATLRAAVFKRTPLWFYILREAAVRPAEPGASSGTRLGRVGGRIVGETIATLIRDDPTSFLSAAWTPSHWPITGEWTMWWQQAYVTYKGDWALFRTANPTVH